MEKLAKIKQEEFEREEAALIPLRHYLMAHVVPTLTKALVEVTRARPTDPVEFLVNY
jgi:adenylate kinase